METGYGNGPVLGGKNALFFTYKYDIYFRLTGWKCPFSVIFVNFTGPVSGPVTGFRDNQAVNLLYGIHVCGSRIDENSCEFLRNLSNYEFVRIRKIFYRFLSKFTIKTR